jgi:alpha-beta hydrolase superfamily lysophospholipase
MPSLFDTAPFNDALFFPRKESRPAPEGAEDLHIPVPEGSLHVRWHRTPGSTKTILLFHGNGEVACDYDSMAPQFAQCGADLAVMDYRGYGLSEGESDYRNMLSDAHLVVEAVAKASALPLVVMGRSLGCACVAELYPRLPEKVCGVVWESGFTDLQGLVYRRGMEVPASFPEEDLRDFDPLPKLRRGSAPFLALHGAEDDIIHPHESQAAHDAAATEKKAIVFVPRKGHNDVFTAPVYWQAMQQFLALI